MLKSISLKFSEGAPLVLPSEGVTIFVGPNNAGKSLVLREIASWFSDWPVPTDHQILENCEFVWGSESDLNALIEKHKRFRSSSTTSDYAVFGRVRSDGGFDSKEIEIKSLTAMLRSKGNARWWGHNVIRWGMIRLDGRSRFTLVRNQAAGDLLKPPGNILAHLFQDDAAREKVRNLIKEAFGMYLVIDPTEIGNLRIKLSEKPPLDDEQSLNATAREYHSAAIAIEDASDGVQAFTGITMAALAGDFHTTLIDEPEAFLHPPLARKLGKNLAKSNSDQGGALMVSTHSPDFLMGCMQANKKVRVVRMEYSKGKSRGRVVDQSELEAMFQQKCKNFLLQVWKELLMSKVER